MTDEKKDIFKGEGIVGLFDILGYKNLLKNNPGTAVATGEEVLNIITTATEKAKETLFNNIPQEVKDNEGFIAFKSVLDTQTQSVIFSDTILITCSYLNEDDNVRKLMKWIIFGLFAKALYTNMFNNGLPIRGAIEFGDFMVKGHSFVGEPIVKAHECAQNLDLAACVLGESAEKEINKIIPSADKFAIEVNVRTILILFVATYSKYEVPKKGNQSQSHWIIPFDFSVIENVDVRQLVLESFWKHNKAITYTAPHLDKRCSNCL